MTRRSEQLASTIQRGVQEILARGLQDPRVSGLITVSGVRLSGDLEEAVVTVSILPEERQDLTMHGLRAAQSHVRQALSELLRRRRTPRITFRLDRSSKRQAAVLRSLARIAEERRSRGEPDPAPPSPEPSP